MNEPYCSRWEYNEQLISHYLLLVFFLLLLFLFRLSLSRLLMKGGMEAQPCSASASKNSAHTSRQARAKLHPQGQTRNRRAASICHILAFSNIPYECLVQVQAFNKWIPCSIFLQYFLSFSLDNDVILNWNKPHQQTTTEGKEGPP